jgi:hypothetical protein
MGFSKDQLSTWRHAIDGPYGAGIEAAIKATGMEPAEPELKRVPAPHDKDHPLATHLRRKSLAVWSDVTDTGDVRTSLLDIFARIRPLYEELDDLM